MTKKERNNLILDNRGLVGVVTLKALRLDYVKRSLGSYEDVFQVGMIGLCKAADGFDAKRKARSGPRKGKPVAFGTYAGKVIWNEIVHTAQESALVGIPSNFNRKTVPEYLNEKAKLALGVKQLDYTKACESLHDRDCHMPILQKIANNEIVDCLIRHLPQLSSRDRKVINTCFGIGVKQAPARTLVRSFKLSTQRIHQIKDSAILFLKDKMEEHGHFTY